MSIKEIAGELVRLCRTGNYQEVHEKFYHENATSEEPQGEPAKVEGMEAIRAKGEWWANAFEYHGGSVSDPIVADNYFSVIFEMDVTNKETGKRVKDAELAVYKVEDGKIVSEQFFY